MVVADGFAGEGAEGTDGAAAGVGGVEVAGCGLGVLC